MRLSADTKHTPHLSSDTCAHALTSTAEAKYKRCAAWAVWYALSKFDIHVQRGPQCARQLVTDNVWNERCNQQHTNQCLLSEYHKPFTEPPHKHCWVASLQIHTCMDNMCSLRNVACMLQCTPWAYTRAHIDACCFPKGTTHKPRMLTIHTVPAVLHC
jgi:hypothetical protein